MSHRSNQAVASQAQTPTAPDEPPRPRRILIGWATAFAALGVSSVLVGFGLWLARMPLAEFFIGAALAERGAEADFRVVDLDLGSATLRDVQFGSPSSPDAAIALVEARWTWSGLSPRLEVLRLVDPRVRLRIDPRGRVSAGALDRLREGPPGRRRAALPRIELEIVNGHALIETPFGALEAPFRAEGRLGEDFSASARITETSRAGDLYALDRGGAELVVVSRDETISFRLDAAAQALSWGDTRTAGASLRALGRAPLDLAGFNIEAAWRLEQLRARDVSAAQFAGAAGLQGRMREDALELRGWEARARASADAFAYDDMSAQSMRLETFAQGEGAQVQGRWTVGADRFAGLALVSEQPAAAGRFYLDQQRALSGDALVTLAQSALNTAAQHDLREAFPNFANAPIGPTFAQAERALDRAADRFTLSVPVSISGDDNGLRFSVITPVEARAATGALLRLAPLRQDAPGLVLQWPGPSLQGAIALELSGGGAPSAALLLDTLVWSHDAPFDADGTISLANWRADGASIAANELGVTIFIEPRNRGGRIDLRGSARITGPIGDGQVRDLTPTLDLAINWGGGWRVTSNSGCLPVRLGGLDAAGLSFAHGNFAFCPLRGALIAADTRQRLSGGFRVQRLALNGRMAGPGAQPARLSASNVTGRFGGRTGAITLALEAASPTLAIDMADERTLAVAMRSLTANAQLGDSWRVDGAFASGTLTDPALPGSVSTIAGSWSAVPEEGRPLIRVSAGQALVTANPPASEAERTLFNPVRLAQVDATLRRGQIDAAGLLLLDEGARQLASFTAHHNVDEGVGVAHVDAPEIMFGPDLQPYEITERARGLVDNVRGPATAIADINWTRGDITAMGRVQFRGVSLATATIPIVEEVYGDVLFDDLFALTTPPGQYLTVRTLDPGVAVRNGRVRFQLLPENRLAIESAEFDFAGGLLAVTPTMIRIGAEETRFELTLHEVDAAELITTLNVPDLRASGRLEGSFPLLLTRRSAYVEGGVVRATGEGGLISYTGNAGLNATGPARVAFDALSSFRYDSLSLTLDGDLNGEVVSSIEFTGHNSGRPVDLGPVAPIPGLGRVTVRGVPFAFNVRVTAPFRRLAQTAATLTDPGSLIDQRQDDEAEPEQEPVDPQPPGTR